jgi:thymidylate kinase
MTTRGKIIAVLGPDGAGKSTLIERVRERLQELGIDTQTFHWRVPLRRSGGPHRVVTDPHAQPPRGLVSSVLKLGWLWATTWPAWLRRVYPARRAGTWTILDRCFDDLICDPRRYRYGGPIWLARVVGRLMPRPDLVIVLHASSAVIRQRKCEVALEELERQLSAYARLARGSRAVPLDVSGEPAAICRQLLPVLGLA